MTNLSCGNSEATTSTSTPSAVQFLSLLSTLPHDTQVKLYSTAFEMAVRIQSGEAIQLPNGIVKMLVDPWLEAFAKSSAK